ncbi:MAG: molybdate ABC transporter substrate-binding protein [Burkholderiales bacterium]|nr:molybdate ABC transporter substrate-binding protein [Burkholderiales bacterium]
MSVLLRLRLPLVFSFLAFCGAVQAQVLVAAASDLRSVLPELIAKFQAGSPHRIKPTYAASGVLYTQLVQGAPFQMFLSADQNFVKRLFDAGKTKDAGHPYAQGRLLLVLPAHLKLPASETLSETEKIQRLMAVWLATEGEKFVIPSPEHAPYGIKAREVLQAVGFWSALQTRLVVGDNAAQASQFLLGGHVNAGLLPVSLLKVQPLPAHLQAMVVPAALHAPLIQRMVLLKNSDASAQAFYDFLLSEQARGVFVQHGFAVVAETH